MTRRPPPAPLEELADNVNYRPVVVLTVAFVLGVVWADAAVPPAAWTAGLCLSAAVAAACFFSFHRPAATVMLVAAAFLAAAALHTLRITPPADDLVHRAPGEVQRIEGQVLRAGQRNPDFQTAVVAVSRADGEPVCGKLLVTLPGEPEIMVGRRVVLGRVTLRLPATAGTPGERDSRRDMARSGIHSRGRARELAIAEAATARAGLEGRLAVLRGRMLHGLHEAMPGPDRELYANVLAGMVYGMSQAPLPDDVVELFRRSGTIHLLVVSGAQVSLILFTILALMQSGRRFGTGAAVAAGACVLVFSIVAGFEPSINRSVLMCFIVLGGLMLARRYDFATSLALSALVLAVVDTSTVFHISTQLTYFCTIGVYLSLPAAPSDRPKWYKVIIEQGLRGTIGAWAFTAPLIAYHFNSLILWGTLANIIAVPISVFILYIGFIAVICAALWPPLAVIPCFLTRSLIEIILQVNHVFAGLPGAAVEGVTLSFAACFAWYALCLGVIWLLRSPGLHQRLLRVHSGWAPGALACTAGLVLLGWAWRVHDGPELRMDIVDVGRGQCIFVRVPGGPDLFFDAGAESYGDEEPAVAVRRLKSFLARQRFRKAEVLFISHPHTDHFNLAPLLLRDFTVNTLATGPPLPADNGWQVLLDEAATAQVNIVRLAAGQVFSLGSQGRIEVLAPWQPLVAGTPDDANNNSLVLKLSWGEVSVLVPGDLQAEGERRLVQRYAGSPERLHSTVLVAGHHGSATSSTPEFLRAVDPSVIAISCGGGVRAPEEDVLTRLHAAAPQLWRTDLHGTITVRTDGHTLTVTPFRKGAPAGAGR